MNVNLAYCPICGGILNTIFADDGIIVDGDMKCLHCKIVWRIVFGAFEHSGEVELLGFKYAGIA